MALKLKDLYDIMDAAGASKDLSERSVYVYKSRLKQLVDEMGAGNVEKVISDPLKTMRDVKPPESRKAYVTAMLSVFSHNEENIALRELAERYRPVWLEEFVRVKALCREKWLSQKPSEAQKLAMIEWNDLLEARDKAQLGSIEHCILGLYAEVVGRNDFCHLYISRSPNVDTNKHPNYIVLQRGKPAVLCLNDFKTNNSRHRRKAMEDGKKQKSPLTLNVSAPAFEMKLSPMLTKSIELSLKQMPREFLLTQERDPLSCYKDKSGCETRVLKILRAALENEHVSINSIRHSFACFVNRDPKLSERDKRKLAARAMHSSGTNKLYCFVDE